MLLDAFVVRMLLMPALMHLLGRSAWWIPRWLDRVLPKLTIEPPETGVATHAAAPSAPPHAPGAQRPVSDS